MSKKLRKLKVNTYSIVSDAIEIGVAYGIRRVLKHRDSISDEASIEAAKDEICNAVINELCDVIDFD